MKKAEIDEYVGAIGNCIKVLRKESNITQLDLATKSELDERQIQRLEAGKTSPTLKTLLKVTGGLDIELLTFFRLVNEKLKK